MRRFSVNSAIALWLMLSCGAASHAQTHVESGTLIALGKALFFDKALSVDGNIACASCHDPAQAYADGKALAVGRGGRVGTRNTPSLLNAAMHTRWSWSGNHTSLEAQVLEPLFSANEHGFLHEREVALKVRDTPSFNALYRAAFGENAAFTVEHIAQALAAFVRSLARHDLPPAFEKKVGGDAAARGRVLFDGVAECASCHRPATAFTDHQFHLQARGPAPPSAALTAAMHQVRHRVGGSKYQRANTPEVAQLGAFVATWNPADVAKFRTPSLLHVARTAPYFHDGSVTHLRDAIVMETTRRKAHTALASDQIDDLLAYLKTLGSMP
jgi:cytochrome c peroxidase